MILVRFLSEVCGSLVGFIMEGHADYADIGEDIVCAAVSSAVYMTVNTITDIMKAEADVTVDDGRMFVRIAADDAVRCRDIFMGLKLHLIGLEEQYPDHIQVHYMEV